MSETTFLSQQGVKNLWASAKERFSSGGSGTRMYLVTLPAARWEIDADGWKLTEEVFVEGVSADSSAQMIQVTPAADSQEAYDHYGIRCIAQRENHLIFAIDLGMNAVPAVDLSVYVAVTEVEHGNL